MLCWIQILELTRGSLWHTFASKNSNDCRGRSREHKETGEDAGCIHNILVGFPRHAIHCIHAADKAHQEGNRKEDNSQAEKGFR